MKSTGFAKILTERRGPTQRTLFQKGKKFMQSFGREEETKYRKPVAVLSLKALWLTSQEEKIFGGYYITYLQHTAVQSWWDLCLVDIVSLSALPTKHYNFDWIG